MADDENKVEIEDWASAFAALDKKDEDNAPADPVEGAGDENTDTSAAGGKEVPDNDATENSGGSEVVVGEPGAVPGGDGQEVGGDPEDVFGDISGDFEAYKKQVEEGLRDRAINDIAAEFIKRGVRHDDRGRLGATIDDADVCKRDEDGVPHFYNPETGQEFRGDNPRRQAQEWVDDYNKELARVFNDACEAYEQTLMEDVAPQLAVRKFAPTYMKLDPITKMMFDNILEGHERYDKDGQVVGHNLAPFGNSYDGVLSLVNKQIKSIQSYAKENGQVSKQQPTGPALDMKTSSGAIPSGDRPAPTSLAEAMERIQDMELEKNKR